MEAKQIKLIKQKLEDAGLDGEDYEGLINQASDVCLCMAEMYQETEPYARSAIRSLEEAHGVMSSAVSGI